MEKLFANDETIKQKFLQAGELSKPFLDTKYVLKMLIENGMCESDFLKIQAIFNWLSKYFSQGDKEFCAKNRFKRNAKEVYESELVSGCNDCALVFATFARQVGISATMLYTAERSWLDNFLDGEKQGLHIGHVFCECFCDGGWVLVDPINRKIVGNYNPNLIELDYNVGSNNRFVAYDRCVDMGERKDMKSFNCEMDKKCVGLKSKNKDEEKYEF